MAKTKAKRDNILFVGQDGKIVIASATGKLTVASAARLPGDLIELLRKRQATGKALTEAFSKANFDVTGASEMQVLDPSGVLSRLAKKRTR